MAATARQATFIASDPIAEAAELIGRLVQVLDDRMTSAGHPYALVQQEHRGTCPPGECSLRCHEYRQLFVDATSWLDARTGAS